MAVKVKEAESRIKVREPAPVPRAGGEVKPYEYPHLYQIQAGEWRISYAVERNHLAILVLEVLNADGTVRKDPASEELARKIKVKLLDWPEGSPSRDLPPEELGKRVKIRLLDLVEEERAAEGQHPRAARRIKLAGTGSRPAKAKGIKFVDGTVKEPSAAPEPTSPSEEDDESGRKVTPLDSPTM